MDKQLLLDEFPEAQEKIEQMFTPVKKRRMVENFRLSYQEEFKTWLLDNLRKFLKPQFQKKERMFSIWRDVDKKVWTALSRAYKEHPDLDVATPLWAKILARYFVAQRWEEYLRPLEDVATPREMRAKGVEL